MKRTLNFVIVFILLLWSSTALADDTGGISGTVTNATDGLPIEDISVWFCNYPSGSYVGYATTQSDSTYAITNLPIGSYRVMISTYGTNYIEEYFDNVYDSDDATSVNVFAGQTTGGIDFGLGTGIDPGDVNGDGAVDLADAIMAMQILTGIEPAEPYYIQADVNGDGKIGMAEMVYYSGGCRNYTTTN